MNATAWKVGSGMSSGIGMDANRIACELTSEKC